MDYKDFKVAEYEFVDESKWLKKLGFAIGNKRDSFFRITPIRPLITFRGPRKWGKRPTLSDVCKAIGYDDPVMLDIISYHQRRIRLRTFIGPLIFPVAFIPAYALLLGTAFLVASIIKGLSKRGAFAALPETTVAALPETTVAALPETTLLWVTLLSIIVIMLIIFSFTFIFFMRLASAITDRRFADTLCIYTIVNLVLELSRDDALTNPSHRMALLSRIDNLARTTLLLFLRYHTKHANNRDWTKKHFDHMELYVRERERWVVAPNETTLSALRRDFYQLAATYITGKYGEFTWPGVVLTREVPPQSWRRRLITKLPRLMGVALPLMLMGFFLWRPDRLPTAIDVKVITLIFIAWLLLAIDAVLKLGIVASVVSLAKGIKDLK